tara:strand:+ start:372 stop:1049 length:678 start_codon:yes stop_codon:yes gene_type:complete
MPLTNAAKAKNAKEAKEKAIALRKKELNKKFGLTKDKPKKRVIRGGKIAKAEPTRAALKRQYKSGKPAKKTESHQSSKTGLSAALKRLSKSIKANFGGTTRNYGTKDQVTNNPKLLKEIADDKRKLKMVNAINKKLSSEDKKLSKVNKDAKGTGRSRDQLKKTRADVKAVVAKRLSGDATGVYGSGKAKTKTNPKKRKTIDSGRRKTPRQRMLDNQNKRLKDRKY